MGLAAGQPLLLPPGVLGGGCLLLRDDTIDAVYQACWSVTKVQVNYGQFKIDSRKTQVSLIISIIF